MIELSGMVGNNIPWKLVQQDIKKSECIITHVIF